MDPGGRQNVPQPHVRVARNHLVRARNGRRHQVEDGEEGLGRIRGNGQVVDVVGGAPELLPHGVVGRVVVHLGRQVVARGQVLEPIQVVPVARASSAGVSVHDLSIHSGEILNLSVEYLPFSPHRYYHRESHEKGKTDYEGGRELRMRKGRLWQ